MTIRHRGRKRNDCNTPPPVRVSGYVIRFSVFLFLLAPLLSAQAPVVGDINFYGVRKLSVEKLQAALGVKPGDVLPPSKGDLEERVEGVPGVVLVNVTAVCCEGQNAMLFVGIEEKGSPHFELHGEPAGDVPLPEGVEEVFLRFLDAVEDATRRGKTAEDLTAGHSLMADPAARAFQTQFIELARKHAPKLREVLRNGSVADQRAIAASILGYFPRKSEVVSDLQYALQDSDEAVRANATRSLISIAVLAARQPDLEIRIPATWFVEMLNSVILSDRLRASEALVTLTESNPAALDQIRERALPALIEMARWKSLRYAVPAFVLVGRIGGLPEDEIHAAWEKGARESIIERALKPRRK